MADLPSMPGGQDWKQQSVDKGNNVSEKDKEKVKEGSAPAQEADQSWKKMQQEIAQANASFKSQGQEQGMSR